MNRFDPLNDKESRNQEHLATGDGVNVTSNAWLIRVLGLPVINFPPPFHYFFSLPIIMNIHHISSDFKMSNCLLVVLLFYLALKKNYFTDSDFSSGLSSKRQSQEKNPRGKDPFTVWRYSNTSLVLCLGTEGQ